MQSQLQSITINYNQLQLPARIHTNLLVQERFMKQHWSWSSALPRPLGPVPPLHWPPITTFRLYFLAGPPPPVAPGTSSAFSMQPYSGPNPYAQPLQSSLRASSRPAAPPPAVHASAYPSPIHNHQGDFLQQQHEKITSTDIITRVQWACSTPWHLHRPSRPTCARSSTPLSLISVLKIMS